MALTKNYTGPTMGTLAPALSPSIPELYLPMSTIAMPIQYQPSRRLIMTGRLAPQDLDPPSIEIPPPPLGRLIFSTFPACYKARTAPFVDRAIRPAEGQQWPRKVVPRKAT